MGRSNSFRLLQVLLLFGTAANFLPVVSLGASKAAAAAAWSVPARAARASNPVPASREAIARGKALYVQECVACHGKTGRGDGPKAPDLKVNPGDFSRPAILQQSDGALFWKITRGRTPMPSYRAKFSEQERWMLVHFVRTLGTAEPKDKPELAQEKPASIPANPFPTDTQKEKEVAKESAATQGEQFVSRQEYERLKGEHEQLKRELASVKAFLKMGAEKDETAGPPAARSPPLQETIQDLEGEMEELRDQLEGASPGTTRTLLTGFASAGFTSRRHEDSAFSANFAPLFLWKMSDQVLFEGELDINLEDSDTDLDLERAQISYILNDYMTWGAGKFLSPMNFLEDRLHQVNKLPDKPLAIRELLPESNIGVQLRGGVSVGRSRLGYAFYVSNAPKINDEDPAALGTLDFDNFRNIDGHVAVGGRIGFNPLSALEIGYGFQVSGLGSTGHRANSVLHSFDLNYVRDFEFLRGMVNVLAQWAWSDVDSFVYDSDGRLGFGPITFENARNGGYAQIAYRPTRLPNKVINRLEPIVRYELFNERHQPTGVDETRWSIGLNYWLMPSAVLKGAYQFGDRSDGQDVEAVLLQFKIGF